MEKRLHKRVALRPVEKLYCKRGNIFIYEEKNQAELQSIRSLCCCLIQRLIAFSEIAGAVGWLILPPGLLLLLGPCPLSAASIHYLSLKSSLCGLMVGNYLQRGSNCGDTGQGCLIYGWPSGRRHHRSDCDCHTVEFTSSCELINGVIYQ